MGVTIHTIYPATGNDGYTNVNDTETNQDTAWSNVRDKTAVDNSWGSPSGDTLVISIQVNAISGSNYYIMQRQANLRFDTSGIADTDTITDAELQFVARWGYGAANVNHEVYSHTQTGLWGTANWIASTDFASRTKLATFYANDLSTSAYTAITNVGTALIDYIDATGNTDIAIVHEAQVSGTRPADGTTSGRFIYSAESASYDPKLVVTSSSGTTHALAATIAASGNVGSGAVTQKHTVSSSVEGSADLASGVLTRIQPLYASVLGSADLASGVVKTYFALTGGLVGSADFKSTTLWHTKGPTSDAWTPESGDTEIWTPTAGDAGSWS